MYDDYSDEVIVKRVLISVFNKANLESIIEYFSNNHVEIISSGGTAKKIKQLGYDVVDVSEITGFPEMPGGLVKTLHPKIHAGILCEDSEEQLEYLLKNNITLFDVIICNLYPFDEAVKSSKPLEECRAQIDIGGPTLIRAGAKNFPRVAVLVNPDDYTNFINQLTQNKNCTTLKQRILLAKKAFNYVTEYDKRISKYFKKVRIK